MDKELILISSYSGLIALTLLNILGGRNTIIKRGG